MDRFESKYNFRFEEIEDSLNDANKEEGRVRFAMDSTGSSRNSSQQIVGHARSVEGSLRRVDDKRKQQREVKKERKLKERRQKVR